MKYPNIIYELMCTFVHIGALFSSNRHHQVNRFITNNFTFLWCGQGMCTVVRLYPELQTDFLTNYRLNFRFIPKGRCRYVRVMSILTSWFFWLDTIYAFFITAVPSLAIIVLNLPILKHLIDCKKVRLNCLLIVSNSNSQRFSQPQGATWWYMYF